MDKDSSALADIRKNWYRCCVYVAWYELRYIERRCIASPFSPSLLRLAVKRGTSFLTLPECNSVCVSAQRASHKSAQGNAWIWGMVSTKSPNGTSLNGFACVT